MATTVSSKSRMVPPPDCRWERRPTPLSRGVRVRINLDATHLAEREPAKVFNVLAETPGVETRTKSKPGAPMHLKSHQTDGKFCCAPVP
jgi:hypothetical protein